MMVSLFYFSFWAIMRGADFARPSALHRCYVQIWLFVLGWAALVAVTVAEDRLRIAAGYMFVFLQSSVFLAVLISLCELFALPKKNAWGLQVRDDQEARDLPWTHRQGDQSPPQLPQREPTPPPGTRHSNAQASASASAPAPANRDEEEGDDADAEPPTERTPLVGGNAAGENGPTTFATTYRRSISSLVSGARRYSAGETEPFENEQAWSGHLPSWTWVLQFLLLGPFTIILAGQAGLMLVDAAHQTGTDGSSLLLPYLLISLFTFLLLLPLTPFMHRVTHHIPVFLLVVFVATLVYNLAAFPFSAQNRYKAFFVQRVDTDTGDVRVCYAGVERYVRAIVADLPSAAGRPVECAAQSSRPGLVTCCYDGAEVPPRLGVVDSESDSDSGRLHHQQHQHMPLVGSGSTDYRHLVTVNATRTAPGRARIHVAANNTKACFLQFDSAQQQQRRVTGLRVHGGAGWDDRFGPFPEGGVQTLKLWHREWDRPWVVDVEWTGGLDGDGSGGDQGTVMAAHGHGDGRDGRHGDGELRRRRAEEAAAAAAAAAAASGALKGAVVCIWSDANVPGTVPALDEALAFAPAWAAVTKMSEGLVEGRKAFEV